VRLRWACHPAYPKRGMPLRQVGAESTVEEIDGQLSKGEHRLLFFGQSDFGTVGSENPTGLPEEVV
jgi:hypothetical protein